MPGALQAIGWARRPYPFMKRCQERYGDVFTLRILHSGTWVFLCDPEDVKRVFTAPAGSLGVALANPLLRPVLGPRSVMLLEEPGHMTRRRLMLPPFHGKRMGADAEMMAEVARGEVAGLARGRAVRALAAHAGDHPGGDHALRLRPRPGRDASAACASLLHRLTAALNDPGRLGMAAALGPRWLARSNGFREAMAPVEEALLEEVDRRRRAGENGRRDIVSILIEARYEDGSPLSEGDLRDELMTLLTDGPTSSSLAWVFERLLRHPEKLARLQAEVLAESRRWAYFGRYRPEIGPSTGRVHGRGGEGDAAALPAGAGRRPPPARADGAGRLRPARRHDGRPLRLPDPPRRGRLPAARASFLPERFLERPPGTYTWIPFGGGTRRCLAASYAELEMKRVLRTVLSEVDLRPADGDSERARRSAISFSPDKRGRVVAEPRTPVPTTPAAEPWQPSPIYS